MPPPLSPFMSMLERDDRAVTPSTPPALGVPAVPTFGAAPAPAPTPQLSMPAFQTPPFVPPTPTRSPQAPSFLGAVAPIIAAAAAGGRDRLAIGTGLAAYLKGQDLKRQEIESAQEREQRKALERAKFYQSVIQGAQQYDDEVALANDLAAMKPLADYYGVSLDGIRIADSRKAAKDRKLMDEAIDRAVREHGAEILNRDDVTLQLADGRKVSMATARAGRAGGVTAKDGAAIPLPMKPTTLTPNTPEEQFLARFAVEKGFKSFGEMPTAQQTEARRAWQKAGGGGGATVGSFEDYVQRTYGDSPTPQQILQARKDYNQSDDRSRAGGGPTDYQAFGMGERLAGTWTKASQPVREMRRQLNIMRTGLDRFRNGDKNGGSQAVLVTFQKILDPTSVVRESEYARTTEGQALMDRIQGYTTRLAQGGTTLTDREMAEMVQTAQQFLAGSEQLMAGTRRRIEDTARRYQLDPALVFDDVLTGAPSGATAPALRYNPATGKVEPVR